MENQSLIPSRNDGSGKHKKGYTTLLATVSTAILFFGLVFYGGVYHRRRDSSRVRASVVVDDGATPIGGDCTHDHSNCVIPNGLDHSVCLSDDGSGSFKTCQSGKPGAFCKQTSDCIPIDGLNPPHAICRKTCQSGQPVTTCKDHFECVTPDYPDAVCSSYRCIQGAPHYNGCGATSDCVVITDLDPPHAVCREHICQSGQPKALCGSSTDCIVITDLDPPHAVCHKGYCENGQPGPAGPGIFVGHCDQPSDCVVIPDLDPPHSVCVGGICGSGQQDAVCGQSSDCVVITDLVPPHAVCRKANGYDKCQNGQPGAACGQTSDCIVQAGLDHAVCRNEKCQRGIKGDYCGQNSDCLSGMRCVGVTDMAKCK